MESRTPVQSLESHRASCYILRRNRRLDLTLMRLRDHRRSFGLLIVVTCSLALGCSGSDGQGGIYGGSCDPGETRSCTCPDGTASQKVCGESGSGYHSCQCADVTITNPDAHEADTSAETSDSFQPDLVQPDVPTDQVQPDLCQPACAGRQCGPDACGGECGTCAGGELCSPEGLCKSVACGGSPTTVSGELVTELGAVDFSDVTVTVSHKRDVDPFEDGCIVEVALDFWRGDGCHFRVTAGETADASGRLAIIEMALSADSQCPSFADDKEGEYQVEGELALGDVSPGLTKVPDENAAQSCFHTTMTVRLGGQIQQAGGDVRLTLFESVLQVEGDFTSTGLMNASCPCAFTCDGKQCGSDGCGGTCGVCGCGEQCEGGTCRFVNCDGKACGDNGCGGSCGACSAWPGSYCNSNNTCACAPDCANKQCGDNGCGASCGNCASGQSCEDGQCVIGPCYPDCSNKSCGPDGCGGDCGTCALWETCQSNGKCLQNDDPGCQAKSSAGCPGCQCAECVCDQDNYCCATKWDSECALMCKVCGSCGGCEPSCSGKQCGSDGCLGSCGVCSPDKVCHLNQCVEDTPPDEWGKACSNDAECGAGLQCWDYQGVGVCTKACQAFSSDCPTGWLCVPLLNICIYYP